MLSEIVDRVIEEAEYISLTGSTVRETAKRFYQSKSTVHKDVTDRLILIDTQLYMKVQKVLQKNLSERHIRGGQATKRKYLAQKEQIKKEW